MNAEVARFGDDDDDEEEEEEEEDDAEVIRFSSSGEMEVERNELKE